MIMDPLEKVRLGNTEVKVTRLGMGGAPMGGLLTEAGPNIANETLKLAYEEGVRYFDTAPPVSYTHLTLPTTPYV